MLCGSFNSDCRSHLMYSRSYTIISYYILSWFVVFVLIILSVAIHGQESSLLPKHARRISFLPFSFQSSPHCARPRWSQGRRRLLPEASSYTDKTTEAADVHGQKLARPGPRPPPPPASMDTRGHRSPQPWCRPRLRVHGPYDALTHDVFTEMAMIEFLYFFFQVVWFFSCEQIRGLPV